MLLLLISLIAVAATGTQICGIISFVFLFLPSSLPLERAVAALALRTGVTLLVNLYCLRAVPFPVLSSLSSSSV